MPAITESPLTSGNSNTDATSYATASITPTANRLILALVNSERSGAEPSAPTLSGNGLTWVQVATILYGGVFTRLTLFRAMGASPSAGAVTISFGAETQLGCQWSIAQFANIDTSGSNGNNAVAQSATNTAVSTSITVTLAAFASVDNATYGGFALDEDAAVTPGTGFAEIHEVQSAGELKTLESEWRTDNDTTVNASGSNAQWGGIAIEIRNASAPAPSGVTGPIFI